MILHQGLLEDDPRVLKVVNNAIQSGQYADFMHHAAEGTIAHEYAHVLHLWITEHGPQDVKDLWNDMRAKNEPSPVSIYALRNQSEAFGEALGAIKTHGAPPSNLFFTETNPRCGGTDKYVLERHGAKVG
jgi:hypothetical protein